MLLDFVFISVKKGDVTLRTLYVRVTKLPCLMYELFCLILRMIYVQNKTWTQAAVCRYLLES